MDEAKRRMGVVNYGLSVTTLEEVFIKVATNREVGDEKKDKDFHANGNGNGKPGEKTATDDLLTADANSGTFCRHFNALFWKRWHITKRDRRQQCCQFLAPLIMLVVGFAILHIPPNAEFPLLTMDVSQYNHPNYVTINQHVPGYFAYNTLPSDATYDHIIANNLTEFQMALLDRRVSFSSHCYALSMPSHCEYVHWFNRSPTKRVDMVHSIMALNWLVQVHIHIWSLPISLVYIHYLSSKIL
jgi:ATP-binding cassette subfamily A (ABC1) protein 3